VCLISSGCAQGYDPSPPAGQAALVAQAPQIQAPAAPPAGGGAGDPVPVLGEVLAERKIIFNGTLDVEVKDFGAAHQGLHALMQQYRAFFAKTEIRGDSGAKRVGTFTIKVPVESFQPLVDALAALGNPVRNATDSQDVTEEYVDVDARVKNLKTEEDVLNKLLKEAGSKLEDVFRIREHVRLNREQIERAEARLNVLGKLTALSTITLTLRDREEYVAPTAVAVTEPPSFGERAAATFSSSFGALRSFGETFALLVIAVAPWLPVMLVVGAIARWGYPWVFPKLSRR